MNGPTYAEKLRAKRVAGARASAALRATWSASGCCRDCGKPRRVGTYCDNCTERRKLQRVARDERIARFVGYRA